MATFSDWFSDASDDIARAIDDIEVELYDLEDAQISRIDSNNLNDIVGKALEWLEQARNYIQNIEIEEEDEENE
jgi:hypothetical protein